MSRIQLALILTSLTATLVLACDQATPTQPSSLINPAAPPGLSTASQMPDFDPNDFVDRIDNPFFPLVRGTRFTYRGTEDGQPEQVVTKVSQRDKTILGVKVTTVVDRLFIVGELREETLDWYAQDEDGNVWYFGEDTKELENGKVVSTQGTWQAGKHGARAGVIMLAHPRVGQSYHQEFATGVAEDRARVLSVNATVSVPYGNFKHCLKTAETTSLEPGAKEIKLNCPGVGFVKGDDVSGGTAHIVLTRISH
ncbi:MAG TPA: hypothetical protein VGN76_00065 [Gemmatimonadales bacterium]|nr:hypothetical protein [Gemmatimonadales bacterium]